MNEFKPLTTREQLVIAGYVALSILGDHIKGPQLFAAASPRALEELERLKDTNNASSAYKNSARVQSAITLYKNRFSHWLKDPAPFERKKGKGINPVTGQEPAPLELPKNVDFANRDDFISYCTAAANRVQDERQRLDYLKILADLQRFKESQTTENNDIQRFYTPLKCCNCPLYKAKKK